ncbi:MAG: peptidylprolyl isomerase [Phycisphaerae bacterium]|nr:peptidylprolyl isomerase [Gemmatimonadaceae bacterium]
MTTKHLLLCLLAVTACQGSDTKAAAPSNESAAPAAAATVPVAPPTALTSPEPAALAAQAPNTFSIIFQTSEGEVEIAVERALAPLGADRLHYLASNGFFNGARFFRVVRGFVAQFGLSGVPAVDAAFETLPIKDDPRKITNAKGTLVFAQSSEPNSRSTQMFINLEDNGPLLDSQGFAPVGRVVRGMDVVEKLFSTYGEMLTQQQSIIASRGNPWLQTRYPELDSIVTATVKQ